MRPRSLSFFLGTALLLSCASTSDSSSSSSSSSSGGATACGAATTTTTASGTDQSAVVADGVAQTIANAAVSSTSVTSSQESSSFYGLNAAVLAKNGGTIDLSCSTVTTTGAGANGVFAYGSGSSITLSKVTIDCAAEGGHGVDATGGAKLSLADVTITTAGAHGAAIATDRGGGTINVSGGTMKTTGQDSPPIYPTGTISVTGATMTSEGSEAAVIEGANAITLADTTLSASRKWGVMIYQSMSGDAEGARGTFTMKGGALSAAVGPLFYVTNTTGIIELSGVSAHAASGTFLQAAAGSWGTAGSNGGRANVTLDAESVTGDVVVDASSNAAIILQNGSTLAGTLDAARTAKSLTLTLDASSTWNETDDSRVSCLVSARLSGGAIANVTGNGHTVLYDEAACSALGGATFTLAGGGILAPGS